MITKYLFIVILLLRTFYIERNNIVNATLHDSNVFP